MVTTTTDGSSLQYHNTNDIWQTTYTAIDNSLAGYGIISNFNLVNSGNVTGFTNLYFAKMSGSDELGRITFAT